MTIFVSLMDCEFAAWFSEELAELVDFAPRMTPRLGYCRKIKRLPEIHFSR